MDDLCGDDVHNEKEDNLTDENMDDLSMGTRNHDENEGDLSDENEGNLSARTMRTYLTTDAEHIISGD